MLEVVVRVDKVDDPGRCIRLTGITRKLPTIGEDFKFLVFKHGHCIEVTLGQVFNMSWYGDIILVQTNLLVAEVQIKSRGDNSGQLNNLQNEKPTLRLVKGDLC